MRDHDFNYDCPCKDCVREAKRRNPMTVNRAKEAARKVCKDPRHGIPALEMRRKPWDCKNCINIATAIQSEVDAAVRAERERCAQVAEDYDCEGHRGHTYDCCGHCCHYLVGQAIRLSKLEKERA